MYKSTIAQHPNTNALPGNKYTHADVQVCLRRTGELTGSCGEDAGTPSDDPGGSVGVPGPEKSPRPAVDATVDHPEAPRGRT